MMARPRRRQASFTARVVSADRWEREGPGVRFGDSMVDLRPLKRTVVQFPIDHPFRVALTAEPDMLPLLEYVGRLPVWFDLLRLKRA